LIFIFEDHRHGSKNNKKPIFAATHVVTTVVITYLSKPNGASI